MNLYSIIKKMENNKNIMKKSWENKANKNAYRWVDSSKKNWNKSDYYKQGEKQALEFIISFLKEKKISDSDLKRMKVLDLGCGTGRITASLSKYFDHVDGIDISSNMIGIAKKDHSNAENLNFHLGNGVDLSNFLEKSFDFVFSYLVFQHIPKKSIVLNYLEEIYRVLKKEGYIKVQVRGYPGDLPQGLHHYNYKGFNTFYIALSRKKGIPFPVIYKYDTVQGVFFKEQEIKKIILKLGFVEVETYHNPQDVRELWVWAKK